MSNLSNKNVEKKPLISFRKILIVVVPLVLGIVFYVFHYEAKYQLAFIENKSAGDCRIKNSAFAYDNNLGFEVHRIKYIQKPSNENNFEEKIKTAEHIYAIDKNKKIFDVSNGKRILGISYEEFIEENSILSDEFLLSGEINKSKLHFSIEKYFDSSTVSSLLILPIYYITYKLNR